MLPKPEHDSGYTQKQIKEICAERGITDDEFEEAFGVNTCLLDDKLGVIYYPCDVERALYKLGKKDGKYHLWD